MSKVRVPRSELLWALCFTKTAHAKQLLRDIVLPDSALYIISVFVVFLSISTHPVVTVATEHKWLLECVSNFIIRFVLLGILFNLSIEQLASNPAWSSLIVVNAILLGSHALLTTILFIHGQWDFNSIVVVLSFTLLTVASQALYLVSRTYPFIVMMMMWTPIIVRLTSLSSNSFVSCTTLLLCLVVLMWFLLTFVKKLVNEFSQAESLQNTRASVERIKSQLNEDFNNRVLFFHGAHHDFKQRLHAIQTIIAKRGLVEDNQLFDKLALALDDLSTYTQDTLELGRLDSQFVNISEKGEVTLQPLAKMNNSIVTLQTLFQQLEVNYEEYAESKDVNLIIRPTTAILVTDRTLILRILENLVSNAIKFARRRVLLTARVQHSNTIIIEIRDDGLGINKNELPALFNPFFKSARATFEQRRGFGLGLSIVKKLSEIATFELAVDSIPGRGTTFRVKIKNGVLQPHRKLPLIECK